MEIYLRDLYKTLDTRESASLLIIKIKQELVSNSASKIILNFDGVDFMSRSFADQFYKEITSDEFGIELTFSNINQTIRETLKIVSKTQSMRKKLNQNKTVYFRFDSISKIEEYLHSI